MNLNRDEMDKFVFTKCIVEKAESYINSVTKDETEKAQLRARIALKFDNVMKTCFKGNYKNI